jgi:hypothetical protein
MRSAVGAHGKCEQKAAREVFTCAPVERGMRAIDT